MDELHVNATVAAPKLLDFKPHPKFVQQTCSFVINLGWGGGFACFQSGESLQLLSLE